MQQPIDFLNRQFVEGEVPELNIAYSAYVTNKYNNISPCDTCVYSPPSSLGGKPCCACDPFDENCNCYEENEDLSTIPSCV